MKNKKIPSKILYLASLILLAGLIHPGIVHPAPGDEAMIARYDFNGNGVDSRGLSETFSLENIQFVEGSLYLNGIYESHGGEGSGYLAIARIPRLNYTSFTVAVRFKSLGFEEKKSTILVGGEWYRWFGLRRNPNGNLEVTFNNQDDVFELRNSTLQANTWYTIVCGVDLEKKRVVTYLDGKKLEEIKLPNNFGLRVMASDAESSERTFTFTNYSNSDVFLGYIDYLYVYGRMLADNVMVQFFPAPKPEAPKPAQPALNPPVLLSPVASQGPQKIFIPVTLTAAGVINDIVEDPTRQGTVYAASSNQGVLVSRDGGRSWKTSGWSQGSVTRVFAVEGTVYALCPSKGLICSRDAGATWTVINPPAPGLTITCAEIPVKSVIYLGTDAGLFVSRDEGASWQSILKKARRVVWVESDPANPKWVVVILEGGGIHIGKKAWQEWDEVAGADPGNARLFSAPGGKSIFFLSRSNGQLFRSTNLDGKWTQVTGLTGQALWLRCTPECKCLLLLTTAGLFQSCDGGRGWDLVRSSVAQNLQALAVLRSGEIIVGGQGVIRRSAVVLEEQQLGDVNFRTGSAELTAQAQKVLNALAAKIKAKPGIRVRVEGHTDNVGADEANLQLSKKRAESVKKYLVAQGIAADRIETEGYGEQFPVAVNDTEPGRAQNRRVVVDLLE